MNFIEFPDKTVLGLSKILDNPGLFNSIKIEESLYGSVPTIDIQLQSNDYQIELNDEILGYLINPYGIRQDFKGYVYKVSYYNSLLNIGILCIDKNFTKTIASVSYPGIISAIQSTYKGPLLTDLKYGEPVGEVDKLRYDPKTYEGSIVREQGKVHQFNESNYKFCTKCCWGYRYNNIFGYCIDGLKFIDLNEFNPVDEIRDNELFHLTNLPEFNSPKLYEKEAQQVNYSIGNDPYHINVLFNDNIIPVNVEYAEVIENQLHNKRYSNSKMTFDASTSELLSYKLGDMLLLHSNQVNFNKVFIAKRVISMQKQSIKLTYNIQSTEL